MVAVNLLRKYKAPINLGEYRKIADQFDEEARIHERQMRLQKHQAEQVLETVVQVKAKLSSNRS